METLRPEEIRTGRAYEEERDAARDSLVEVRGPRRLQLGEHLCLVFDNRGTIRSAAEEGLRNDGVVDSARVAAEASAFADLLGDRHTLRAVLYVDVADPAQLQAQLGELDGAERTLVFEVGEHRVHAVAEESLSAATPVVVQLDAAAAAAFRDATVAVAVEHPKVMQRVVLDEQQRHALAGDLGV